MTRQFIPHNRSEAEAWALSEQWWKAIYDGPGETRWLVAPQVHPDEMDDPNAERSVMPVDEAVAEGLSIPWPPAQDWLQNLPMAGDVRTFDGVEYRSLIDNNVWSPDAYPQGWEPVEAPTGPQAWVQPTGSHDAYPAGAMVTHSGATWENTHGDGNVWEPGVFGWIEVTP